MQLSTYMFEFFSNQKTYFVKSQLSAIITLVFCLCFLFGGYYFYNKNINSEKRQEVAFEDEGKKIPSDYFFKQRAFPFNEINHEAYLKSIQQRKKIIQKKKQQHKVAEETWHFAGPTNIGGRISDIAVHPSDANTIYAGTASGGVFKSIDFGENWNPIFDNEATLSIGAIAVAQSNKEVLYVGTGEANAGGGSLTYDGVGVYKSTASGKHWKYIGLPNSRSIGKIVIDPTDENKVFVAAMGNLFGNNSDRGIYRTTDGGDSWEQVLYVSDSTGGIDLSIHPDNPDIIYASMWERVRRVSYRKYGGNSCGIYRSTDGGDNWEKLTNGLPQENIGRMGVAVAPSSPNIVYVVAADETGYYKGFYKSEDNGDSWISSTNSNLFDTYFYSSYGWWFGKLTVDPQDSDKVYAMGLALYKSNNGGQSWQETSNNAHLDQHALYIHPTNPDTMVLGNDGGIYTNKSGSQFWNHANNLPITQFYKCEIDFNEPHKIYGGSQDNGTVGTKTGYIDNWTSFYFGDGFTVKVDPMDSKYMYAEYQYGNLAVSTNGGNTFSPISTPSSAYNWNTPYVLDPKEKFTLYLGGKKVYKSTNRGTSWNSISNVLSNEHPPSNLVFGTITTIDVSTLDNNVIYAGTDDGNVWRTLNGGAQWKILSDTLPERWVTCVATDPKDINKAYVTFSGYRFDEYLPHIFKTEDDGENWIDISNNLPETPINDLIVDPDSTGWLYIATDVGVFVSLNDGESWDILDESLPNLVISDLSYHPPTKKLLAATYGRSMYDMDLSYLRNPIDTMANDTTIVDTTIVDIDTTMNDTTIVDIDTTMNDSTDITAILPIEFAEPNISVFPNPATVHSKIRVELSEPCFGIISIYNSSGKNLGIIYEGIFNSGENIFGMSELGLGCGVYFVVTSTLGFDFAQPSGSAQSQISYSGVKRFVVF